MEYLTEKRTFEPDQLKLVHEFEDGQLYTGTDSTGVNVLVKKNDAGYSEAPDLDTEDMEIWLEPTGLSQEQLCELVSDYEIWG